MPFNNAAVNAAHSDGNQMFSGMGVIGTLGTSDVSGTALTLPISVDAATGAQWQREIGTPTFILQGGTLQSGTIGNINAIGTIGTLGLGTVVVSGGTFNAGTFSNAGTNVNIVTGSLVGTILGGTIQNLNAGTITALGAGTITTGTMSVTIGTITGKDANATAITAQPIAVGGTDSGGTVRNMLVDATGVARSTGSQVMTVGTLTTGTLQNLVSGTINALAAGTITAGTLTNLATGTINALAAGTITAGTLTNLVSGTINALAAGTITAGTLTNLATGTLNALASGTITGGTLNNLNSGSIVVTTGTVNTGTVSVTIGTMLKFSPAASAGSFTAAGSVVITGSQYDAAAFDLQGTWVGTTFFEGQIGTSSWFAIPAITSLGVSVGSATANGDYFTDMSALDGVRARLTYSSGTQTYNARASAFAPSTQTIAGGSINVVSNVTNGSYVMTVGTLTTGTLQNLVTGTINALAAGTITTGTISMTTGTLNGGTLTNLVSGTINALAAGTITTGTISMTTGTLSPLPTIANSPFGTHGTTGVSVFGTLAGGTSSGAGTEIFITSLSLTLPSTAGSQDVSIGWGTNGGTFHAGTGLLVRGNFIAGGGIQKSFWPPVNSGTNAQLTYFQAGAGTVDISVTYFITASTI